MTKQDTPQVVCDFRLPADAVDATARGNALANSGANSCKTDCEASTHCRQSRDPDAATACFFCMGRKWRCERHACGHSRHAAAGYTALQWERCWLWSCNEGTANRCHSTQSEDEHAGGEQH